MSCGGNIEQGHSVPSLLVGVGADHFLVRCAVGLEVRKAHIGVGHALAAQQVSRDVGKGLTCKAVGQIVDHARQALVCGVVIGGAIALQPKSVHLLGGQTEDEHILRSCLGKHLHVCAVQRTDGERAVDHQLHAARAAGLLACQRDLLADLGRGNEGLGHADVVVLEEDEIDLLADARILLDVLADHAEQLDDALGHVVARGGLGAEDEGLGLQVEVGIFLQIKIQTDHVEGVEQLSLVLVQTLDLHVKDRVGIQLFARLSKDQVGKADLVLVLDGSQALEHGLVVGKLGKVREALGLVAVGRSDAILNEACQSGVGIAEPAAVCHAVGDVVKLLGIEAVELLEGGVLENAGVQLGYAVDVVRGDDRKVGHAHLPVGDHAHLGDAVPASWGGTPRLGAEALVDLLENGVDAGELEAEEILVPGLERLGHDGVVGVGDGTGDDIPGLLPGEEIIVHQNAHQLGNAERGMRVVDVNGDLLVQIVQTSVDRHVVADDALHRGRHQEILLRQAQKLALGVVVGGIEHLGDDLGVGAFLKRTGVLSLREQAHVEILNVSCLPQTELADGGAVRARDHHVVGNGLDLLGVLVDDGAVAVLAPLLSDAAAKADLVDAVGAGNQPNVAAWQPDVGQLNLHTVHDHLLEESVLVADGKARGGIIERGEGVHKAGGKAAKSSVAKSCIGLAFVKLLQGKAERGEGLVISLVQAEVAEIGPQRAAEQEFHAHIVDALCALAVDLLFVGGSLFAQHILDGDGRRLIHLLARCLGRRAAKMSPQNGFELFSDLCAVGIVVHG